MLTKSDVGHLPGKLQLILADQSQLYSQIAQNFTYVRTANGEQLMEKHNQHKNECLYILDAIIFAHLLDIQYNVMENKTLV